jgi:aminopeptidase YwaD
MSSTYLSSKAEEYLHKLCLEIPTRRVGSAGNRAATDFFATFLRSFDYEIEAPTFDCIDWTQDGADLSVEGENFEAFVSPYSLGDSVSAPLVVASSVDQLKGLDADGRVLLVQGELCKEQLMPKNFVFYNPDHHKEIVALLESKQPAAIVAATTRDPALAGGMYPFPLIEDGDFDIPSVYMTDVEGQRLAERAGKTVSLRMRAERAPATGHNVIARKGEPTLPRVVYVAHIDAKDNSPGAIDNGTGVVILLLLAELLADYTGELGVEILAVNGEDYYSAPGEMHYLQTLAEHFSTIQLAVNMDGAGYHQRDTAYSLYDPPPAIAEVIHQAMALHPGIAEGAQWYQSDHSMFIQQGVPALAITSNHFMEQLAVDITHTPKDHPEIVDFSKLAEIALGLRDLHLALDQLSIEN